MKQKMVSITTTATIGAFLTLLMPGAVFAAGQTSQSLQSSLKSNPIIADVQIIVNFLSAGVGIVVVAMIIIGGIQYIIAGDNPQKLTAAKHRITNALIALVAFILTFSFLQWLIPGGIFG